MKIIFITREQEVCSIIASRLPAAEYSCEIQTDVMIFYDELLNKKVAVDLIVCDYRLYRHELFNLYQFLTEKNKSVPLIFYNDPFPADGGRVLHWIIQNQEQYSRYDLDYLRPVLEKIAAIIEDPSVRPYISLIQPPLLISSEMFPDSQKNRIIDLRLLRRRNNMTPSMYRLFEYLYKNRDQDCSVLNIEKFLWHRNSRNKKHGGVYSYISRLRKCIEKDSLVKLDIMRTSQGFYRMIVY